MAAQVASYLYPLFLALLAYLVKRAMDAIAKMSASARVKNALSQVAQVMRTVVQNASQRVVDDLKNPNKPGEWNKAAMASVKESTLEDGRSLLKGALSVLKTDGGYAPDELNTLLDRMLEAAVRETKVITVDPLPEFKPLPSAGAQ